MSNYTPSTEEVRFLYVNHQDPAGRLSSDDLSREFDRWLAAELDKARAEVRADQSRKIAAAIRARFAGGTVVGDDTWNDGMEHAARIAEGAGRG